MRPSLLQLGPRGATRGVVLVAHGGTSHSAARDSHLRGPALRMLPFSGDLIIVGRRRGLAVAQLRYRMRGYNNGEPVEDVCWAIDRLWSHHGAPICLVGHSMGARAALRAAGHPAVTAVAALAPWLPPGEPIDQLDGRELLIVHGQADRVTAPARSAEYARRARRVARRVRHVEVARSGHAMLRRPLVWQRMVREFCLEQLGVVTAMPAAGADEVTL